MLTKLVDRKIFEICGNFNESLRFFQGITTNDLFDEQSIIYSLFLTPSGRFLFDVFFLKIKNSLFIDCNINISEQLKQHITKYKMRLELSLQNTDYIVYSCNYDEQNYKENFIDPRTSKLGKRIITNEVIEENTDFLEYQKLRIKHHIIDGYYDMEYERSLPVNFNLYNLNAICLNKGCFIGQESVNHLFRNSHIKRKLYCLKNENENTASVCKGDKVLDSNKNECGMVCSGAGELLLCLLEKEENFFLINNIRYIIF